MTDDVTIPSKVEVDIDNLDRFDDHVAIAPAEPLEVVYRNDKTFRSRTATVHGFTAAGEPLVLDDNARKLVVARHSEHANETIDRVRTLEATDEPRGPFSPAPPGLVAVYRDGSRAPVVFYDVYGRAVTVDFDDQVRQLMLPEHDEEVVRFESTLAGEVITGSETDA